MLPELLVELSTKIGDPSKRTPKLQKFLLIRIFKGAWETLNHSKTMLLEKPSLLLVARRSTLKFMDSFQIYDMAQHDIEISHTIIY